MEKERTSPWLILFRVVFTAALIACIMFIFRNSLENGAQSSARSQAVMQLVNSALAKVHLGPLSEHLIRKLAHFAEFALEGFLLMLCIRVYIDPDDKTPLAIKNTGARIVSYGAPVLPGAMFLVSYYEYKDKTIPIVGLPGCVMYAKRTIFDLALPRLLADDFITAEELALLGEGGLCLNCPVCTYPNCGFGKGW